MVTTCSTPRPLIRGSKGMWVVLVADGLGVHARVRLVAGHGRGAVVQDHQGEVVVVVHRVDQAGDAAVEEGAVADEGHHLLVRGREMPPALETEEPMQIRKSAALMGGNRPRV